MRAAILPLLLATAAAKIPAAEPYGLTATEVSSLAKASRSSLTAPIRTIIDRPQESPAKDPHDYVSYARYYWPDPAKPDGLPYVRHDGRHNREQVAKGDHERLGNFCSAVEKLAAAWRVNRDEAAARRAGEWLRAWLISPATRMNPNLEYAQVRLGHDGGRGSPAGVLDARGLAQVIDALILLRDSPALTPADEKSIRAWFSTYLNWLQTARTAKAEHAAKNNHGSWFLAQIIPIARYVGRDDLARQLCEEDKARITGQIKADGSQPEEIRRVDGLGYSVYNLEAQARVARLAAGLGIDLWNHTAPDGAGLRRAIEFLKPFNSSPETWPFSQKAKLRPGFLDKLIAEAAAHPAAQGIPR